MRRRIKDFIFSVPNHMVMGNSIKVAIVFAACLLFRLLPFRAPNFEPILASQMPLAKEFGGLAGFLFGAFSIFVFDIATGTLGLWSFITAPAYGMLGFGAAWYLKNRGGTRHFVYFAIAGTFFYDAATGLTVGPLFFHQPFISAALGQIPFTIIHLLGNVSLSLVWSPLIERWFAAQLQKKVSVNLLPKMRDIIF